MKDSTVVLVGALAFLAAGGAMAWAGLRSRRLSAASTTWPTAPGRILSSAMARGAKGSVRVMISYTYAVNGQNFTGNVVTFSGVTSLNEANRMTEVYPANRDVSVHYNPAQPSQAVLEPGGSGSAVLMIIGALMLAFAVGGFAMFAAIAAQGR